MRKVKKAAAKKYFYPVRILASELLLMSTAKRKRFAGQLPNRIHIGTDKEHKL